MDTCLLLLCLFPFFSSKPEDWLGRTFAKWNILCRVWRKTLTQSLHLWTRFAAQCEGLAVTCGSWTEWHCGAYCMFPPPTFWYHHSHVIVDNRAVKWLMLLLPFFKQLYAQYRMAHKSRSFITVSQQGAIMLLSVTLTYADRACEFFIVRLITKSAIKSPLRVQPRPEIVSGLWSFFVPPFMWTLYAADTIALLFVDFYHCRVCGCHQTRM